MSDGSSGRLAIVGIGEDGWDGLGETARAALRAARTLIGSQRQLDLVPGEVTAAREAWPRPFMGRVDDLAAAINGGEDPARWTVLASGDPMFHGVGTTLAGRIDPALLHVLPAPSAFSIACARLGWASDATPLVSRVKDPKGPIIGRLAQGGRCIIYVPGTGGAAAVAEELRTNGLGLARLVVMERLGGPHERIIETSAQHWSADADDLHLVAVELPAPINDLLAASSPDPAAQLAPALAARLASTVPGLPDEAYLGDGQLTRAEVRAVVLAALAPRPGELLWDLGAGSGTIRIEWVRAAQGARAAGVERRADRSATVAENATRLGAGTATGPGAPGVALLTGDILERLDALPPPDAIFIGGGGTTEVIDRCWAELTAGGRLVANAVTLEGEQALIAAHAAHGGSLIRLEFSRAEPLGSFSGWKPYRPIVQWSATKDPSPA